MNFKKIKYFLNKRDIRKRLLQDINNDYLQLSLLDKMELKYIEKSNLKAVFPFANVYLLLLVQIILFALAFNKMIEVFRFMPTALLMGVFVAVVPLLLLEIMGRINTDNIRLNLGDFIACIGRWLSVKEDLFFALEKAGESVKNPLKKYVKEMCLQVKMGVEKDQALDILAYKVDNEQFKDFILNLKSNIKSRGDVCKLVQVMENQFYEVQREFVRRKINSFQDKVLLYLTAIVVIVIAIYLLTMVDGAKAFYIGTSIGKGLMLLFCGIFVFGTYLFSKIG